MNAVSFLDQVRAMSDRLGNLYTGANTASFSTETLVSAAFKELGIASERLQIAAELIHRQQQELNGSEQAIAAEQQRYQDLLEFIPDACLITNAIGIVQAANQAAAHLLHISPALLLGQPLVQFIPPATQPQFQAQLHQVRQQVRQHWKMRLLPRQGSPIDTIAIVEASGSSIGSPLTLRWLLRANCELETSNSPIAPYLLQRYPKGEGIALDPQVIWQVCKGLVKLSTFSSSGEEMMVGLATPSAVFGASLVTSPLYQAIALRDTQLRRISLAEIAASPELAQSLFPHLGQRLRQSEALLHVYGQPRVDDRVYALLLFLKQEIGEPTSEGTRLTVRFTHEELANACRTTRVTVTRTLGQLVRQQKISLDAKQHLIVK